ncbi:hypothetical protein ABBQ32_004111 [Trebouxia sp. C0010 RCD-2024]
MVRYHSRMHTSPFGDSILSANAIQRHTAVQTSCVGLAVWSFAWIYMLGLLADIQQNAKRLYPMGFLFGKGATVCTAVQETGEGGLLPPHLDIKALLFPVDNFICIGSPLGLFLALRGVDPSKGRALGTPPAPPSTSSPSPTSTADGLPAANRIYNLYQPYDPVAYRMEPLIVVGGEKRKPVFAPYYKGGRRLHIGMAEFAEDFGGSVSKAALGSVSVMRMAAGYLGKAVVASKVEKKMDQAGRPLDPSVPAAAATDDEAGLDAEEGTPADEADVQLKSNASESAIWRLTAGKGEMGVEGAGPLGKSGSLGSGDYSSDYSGLKAREPTSERRTAAGRIDFVLQVRSHLIVMILVVIDVHLLHMSVCDKRPHRNRIINLQH